MFFDPQGRAFCVGRFRVHLLFIFFLILLCVYTWIFVVKAGYTILHVVLFIF